MKAEVDKLDIDKLVNVPSCLNSLKFKVDVVDVGKLKTVPVDLKKSSDVVVNDVVKKTKCNNLSSELTGLKNGFPEVSTLIHINQYNTHSKALTYINHHNTYKQGLKKKWKIMIKKPDASKIVTNNAFDTKIGDAENKIPDVNHWHLMK